MISDERLREAARKAEESILATLPEPENCEVILSPECESNMKKLIRRTDHLIRHRIMKAVACFLLVILVGGGGILTFSVEARAAAAGWVRDIYESYKTWIVYYYVGEENTAAEDTGYRPTWIPEGYTEQDILELSGQTDIHYVNADNLLITFGYSSNYSAISFYVERDGAELHQVYIGDIPADLYLDVSEEEPNVLTWYDENTKTIFWIIAQENSDDLIKIAESVVKKK